MFSSHRQVLYEAHHLFFTHTIIHKLHCLVGLLMCVLARFTLMHVFQYTFTMLVANAHMYLCCLKTVCSNIEAAIVNLLY